MFTALNVTCCCVIYSHNTHRDSTPISIRLFVEKYYCGYDLIDDEAVICLNIFTFACSPTSHCYYLDNE